MKSSKIDKPTS